MFDSWLFYIILAFLLSLGFTFFAMPFLLRLCKRKKMYDIPDERKVHHSNNIPRLGGILFIPSMFIGVSIPLILIQIFGKEGLVSMNITTMLVVVGMFLLYLIGVLDDLFGMKASMKFLIQLIVSLFLPFCGLYIHNLYGLFGLFEIPMWLSYPLTVFVSLLIVNSINLIDGIDGLSSSLSLIAISVFAFLFYRHNMMIYVLYCMGLSGSVLAFFYYNMFGNPNKATKTFMGDTGSLTLGYALAFLAIRYVMTSVTSDPEKMHATALLVPYTLLIVPCFDLVRVALMRIKRHVGIFHPDKTHIHHKCMYAGFTMHQSLLLIISLQFFFTLVNCGLIVLQATMSFIVIIDIVIFALFQFWLNYRIQRKGTLTI